MKYAHHQPLRSVSIWLVESRTQLQDSQSTASILSLRTSKGCRFGTASTTRRASSPPRKYSCSW